MKNVDRPTVIWSGDVLSRQVCAMSDEYRAELQRGKLQTDLLLPSEFTDTENRNA